jgi:predicted nucleotidyltransferase component of viral defense system
LIDRQEIMEFSRELRLTANVIEKDYVIGWMLAGISNHAELGASWVFKGGTCLKKCFFETYRFSEDLDFTLTNPENLNRTYLVEAFQKISEWIYDAAGIEMPRETINFEIFENPHGGISAQGRIGYRGPMQPRGDLPRIKLDLTADELVTLDPTIREVYHPYSDRPDGGIRIQCYSFEEIFAEKLRALTERERPRDLYDVIHIYRKVEQSLDRTLVLSTLEQKCAFKGIDVPKMEALENQPERAELESEWANMLAHQLPVLPAFEQFWQELPLVLKWLYGKAIPISQPSIPAMGQSIDESWRPPAMAQAWHTTSPLEIIRFAAANHLCVDLFYQNGHRLIEPYSLRRTRDGNLLLFAIKHHTRENRSYRVDRIQGAEVTKQSFTPQYAIELTQSGPISALPLARKSSSFGMRSPRTVRRKRIHTTQRLSTFGPKYVFRCSICGKQFTRKSYKTSLNPHENKQGYPCPGHTGIYITTKY